MVFKTIPFSLPLLRLRLSSFLTVRFLSSSSPSFPTSRSNHQKLHNFLYPDCVSDAILGHGVEPAANSFQKQIINELKLGEKGKASSLLQDLTHEKQSLGADDFVDIFKYCASSIDPLFAMETLKIMQQYQVNPNDKCYFHLICALCNGGYLEQAFSMIKIIGDSDYNQSLSLYNNFLKACCKALNMDLLNQCLAMMENKMVAKNEVTYLARLELAAFQKNNSEVHDIWEEYVKYYPLNFVSLRKFIWSFTILKDLKSACKALQYMASLFLQENSFSTGSAEGNLYSNSSKLDIPIPFCGEKGLEKFNLKGDQQLLSSIANMSTEAPRLKTSFGCSNGEIESVGIDELISKDVRMETLRLSFTYVIHACALTQNSGLAEQLMLQMLKFGVQPSSYTYEGFIKAMVRDRGFSEGIKLLKIMQKTDLKPSDSTLAAISISCSKALELDLAEALLDQMSNCSYPHPYNAFLAACSKADQPDRGIKMFSKMERFNVEPDNVTYKQLLALFSTVNAPYESGSPSSMVDSAKRIEAIEMYRARNGLQPSKSSMGIMLKGLGAEGLTKELIGYLQQALHHICKSDGDTDTGTSFYNTVLHSLVEANKLKGLESEGLAGKLIRNLLQALHHICKSDSDTDTGTSFYNALLHSLVEANEIQMAINVYQDMRSLGLPDAATYAIMIHCCGNIPCYKSASALFSMMLRRGFPPQACHYTSLLRVLLKAEDMNEALNALDSWKIEESLLDVIFYNTIIEQALVQGRIDVIEFVVEEMYRNKVQPDSTTCAYVFTAYVRYGFHNTAVQALQVLSLRMISEDEDELQQEREEFDDIIHSEDTDSEARILEFFTNFEERTAVALLSLRWCAISGFSISWFPNQTPWARRLAADYNSRVRIT